MGLMWRGSTIHKSLSRVPALIRCTQTFSFLSLKQERARSRRGMAVDGPAVYLCLCPAGLEDEALEVRALQWLPESIENPNVKLS